MDIKRFIMCACNGEGLVLEKFKNESEVYLSLFGRGLNIQRYGWKSRLRHIWQILTKGFPYTDEIVLTKKDAQYLAKSLKEFTK
jgi:hypothetical protein